MSENNKIISIDELYGVYKEGREDELILDLRSGSDYRETYIEGSLSIPFNRLQLGSFDLKKIKRAYLLCKIGSEAPMGARQMERLYPDLEIYFVAQGGFDEWVEKKYPVLTSKVLKLKNIAQLEQNEPDFMNLKKVTRRLAQHQEARIENLLPKSIEVHYFRDHERNCYLLSDKQRGESILINPLIEIHHHIIDQLIRLDCECVAILYDEHLRWHHSPPPVVHAKDFSQLTTANAYSFSSLCHPEEVPWSQDLSPLMDDTGHTGILYKGIVFCCKQFSLKKYLEWIPLEIC